HPAVACKSLAAVRAHKHQPVRRGPDRGPARGGDVYAPVEPSAPFTVPGRNAAGKGPDQARRLGDPGDPGDPEAGAGRDVGVVLYVVYFDELVDGGVVDPGHPVE